MRDSVLMVGGINMQDRNSGPSVDSYGLKGPFKGHMALKSSPLAATSTRLSNQYLVQDQMTSHYRRVNSAKAVVDTKPPKSMQISTKTRDRQRRRELERQSRMSSRASSRASCDYTPPRSSRLRDDYERHLTDFEYDFVNDMVADTRHSPSAYKTPRTTRSAVPPEWPTRTQTPQEDRPPSSTMKWDRMDLLDTSRHKFKEPAQPYTPRTLKREAQSKIAQSKNYNPPKRKPEKKEAKLGETKDSEFLSTGYSAPEYNGEQERTASTNLALNATMRYSDIEKTKKTLVPTLKIRRDEDHAKWVEEQAKHVAAMNLNETAEYDDYMMDGVDESSTMKSDGLGRTKAFTMKGPDSDGMNDTKAFTTMRSEIDRDPSYSVKHTSTRPYLSYARRLSNAKVKEEEEELKYLEFVTDVTNDVLNRGIYSNRVLKQIFEKHIERNRGKLDERRMHRLMEQLRVDLGIPEYE